MTLFFPFAISQVGESRVSVHRIQDFLSLEERDSQNSRRKFLPPSKKVGNIILYDGYLFFWGGVSFA